MDVEDVSVGEETVVVVALVGGTTVVTVVVELLPHAVMLSAASAARVHIRMRTTFVDPTDARIIRPRQVGAGASGSTNASRAIAAYPPALVSGGFEHSLKVQLRWRDMDMLGHLNQSVYHELLEEGRAALMTEIIRQVGAEQAHGTFVLVHVDLDYHREVRKDHGEVEVVVRLERVGGSSLTLAHEVRLPDGVVAASGQTVLVAWDPVARGKRPLSDAERSVLA